MSARPVPYVLVHVREPVGGERAARDFVAVPLTPEVIERIWKQSLTWLRISMESRASAMKFELPEAHWYEGHDPDRGWMPAEFAGDPSWEEEFDVEVEIPAVVRRVVEEEVLAFADESALDVMDSRVETRAELLFEFDEMRIEVGPGRDGVRLQSHELPAGVLIWGALYWGLPNDRRNCFESLASVDPKMALDLIEHGFVIEGAESATRLPIGPIAPAALTSLLDHEDREIRTRAVLLAARASEQPARREGGRRRA